MIELNSVEEWEAIFEREDHKPFWLLKHSTTCPISAQAYGQVEEYMKISNDVDTYFIKVRESAPVSNQIETDIKVKHASPQLLLIKNKRVLWNTSHWDITKENMDEAGEILID